MRSSNVQNCPRTGHILFEDIKLLEDGAQKALRMFVDDEDLPLSGRIDGPDGVQKF
jgi:hypothetical protein